MGEVEIPTAKGKRVVDSPSRRPRLPPLPILFTRFEILPITDQNFRCSKSCDRLIHISSIALSLPTSLTLRTCDPLPNSWLPLTTHHLPSSFTSSLPTHRLNLCAPTFRDSPAALPPDVLRPALTRHACAIHCLPSRLS